MLQFRLSNVILMVTTKKIVKEYTQKEMRRKLICFTTKKKSAKHKKTGKNRNKSEGKKAPAKKASAKPHQKAQAGAVKTQKTPKFGSKAKTTKSKKAI